MNLKYRQGKREDSQRIAELDYIASDGVVEYLFHDLVPGLSALQLLSNGLEQDEYPHTFRSCIVAESDQEIVGMALSYPAEHHCITDELANFLPADRLKRFREFYSSRVEGSYFLDAMSVEEKYRGLGIGKALLEKTKVKASSEGYSELSLIVFADNTRAINLYEHSGFKRVKNIELQPHHLIPHEGGCILMNCVL
ncbi:GNAT family N-acetyltransferase [Haliea salexigens]|uniref:GNAT family N-acetyltransferase n=1 Tax=Haliea salexigens TaxID=287487 RepID=UPI00047FA76E|nr:GNAT family N-acetyltransferase [Haliea salexigens]|tara:strand:- start:58 stop:645 length:588 start_codon:yes stop_codon:yes gene_type:complete